jgi:exonuclease V
MASHSTEECTANPINDDETDYGSDFSPEEEEILLDLTSGRQQVEPEDNPIVTKIESNDEPTLRVPRTLGGESKFPLLQAAQAADEVAERIRVSVKNGNDSNCKTVKFGLFE